MSKRKRKCDTHDVGTLLRIFKENGGERNYPEITRLYNEEMGGNWTQDQINKKMQNVRGQIRSGKIIVTETNEEKNVVDPTGRNAFLVTIYFL